MFIMSAFKTLRDVSARFEEDLRHVSSELFTSRIDEPFEEIIAKKLKDLSLYTSKLRLLQAKPLCAFSLSSSQADEHTTIANYTDAVRRKIIEQQVAKSIIQAHNVKALITAADSSLDPEMLERKEKIIEQLMKFKDKEIQLRHLDSLLKERQHHHEEVRQMWDSQLSLLRQKRTEVSEIGQEDESSPLSKKLHRLEEKLTLLRALLARLASARGGGYDWLADPRRRLRALQLARHSS